MDGFPTPYRGVSAKASRKRGKSSEDTVMMEATLERRFAPARIRDLIVKTIQFMELDYIVIVIDEWMTLSECQVEFAESLRRTLFNDRHIAVKIAADQYQCVFNNGAPRSQAARLRDRSRRKRCQLTSTCRSAIHADVRSCSRSPYTSG